jgi:hypothetical protein
MTRELLAALAAPRPAASVPVGAGVPDGPLSDAHPAPSAPHAGRKRIPHPPDPRIG